jgi:hypothetical protein
MSCDICLGPNRRSLAAKHEVDPSRAYDDEQAAINGMPRSSFAANRIDKGEHAESGSNKNVETKLDCRVDIAGIRLQRK